MSNPTWKEKLPPKCPPENAVPSEGQYCRLVEKEKAGEKDFVPVGRERPNDKRGDPCTRMAISLYSTFENCRYAVKVRKLPTLKTKTHVALLKFKPYDGVVKQTGKRGHFSWWVSGNCDPLACCESIIPL